MLDLVPLLAVPPVIVTSTIAIVSLVASLDTGKRGRAALRTLRVLVRLRPPKE